MAVNTKRPRQLRCCRGLFSSGTSYRLTLCVFRPRALIELASFAAASFVRFTVRFASERAFVDTFDASFLIFCPSAMTLSSLWGLCLRTQNSGALVACCREWLGSHRGSLTGSPPILVVTRLITSH